MLYFFQYALIQYEPNHFLNVSLSRQPQSLD